MRKTVLLFLLMCVFLLAAESISACNGIEIGGQCYTSNSSGLLNANASYDVKNYLTSELYITAFGSETGPYYQGGSSDNTSISLPYDCSFSLQWSYNRIDLSIAQVVAGGSSSAAAEKKYVFIYPQDEVGEYYFNEDGAKEYISYRSYDICMRYMGSESACVNSIR